MITNLFVVLTNLTRINHLNSSVGIEFHAAVYWRNKEEVGDLDQRVHAERENLESLPPQSMHGTTTSQSREK